MGKCLHIDSSNWLATGFWLSIFSRCTAQVRLAYVTVDLLCWCAVHTVYVVRLCTAVLEPRTAASISQAAGGSCIISHLQQSVPTRFHGRHSTLRRPQCFALVSRLSKRHQHVSEEKKETASLQSNPPPIIHLGEYCRLKLSQAASKKVWSASTNTSCGLLCGWTFRQVLPRFPNEHCVVWKVSGLAGLSWCE